VGKPLGEWSLLRLRRRWEDNISMDLREVRDSGSYPMLGFGISSVQTLVSVIIELADTFLIVPEN
jgi:hypothetical protein